MTTDRKTLTVTLMDGPFEQARTTTALRLLQDAAERGWHLNVFAYEGAVYLAYTEQSPHGNAVHGHDVDEEDHPLPKDWLLQIKATAEANGGSFDWINCGLCEDERGAHPPIEGARRGGPAGLVEWAEQSDATLIIPTR